MFQEQIVKIIQWQASERTFLGQPADIHLAVKVGKIYLSFVPKRDGHEHDIVAVGSCLTPALKASGVPGMDTKVGYFREYREDDEYIGTQLPTIEINLNQFPHLFHDAENWICEQIMQGPRGYNFYTFNCCSIILPLFKVLEPKGICKPKLGIPIDTPSYVVQYAKNLSIYFNKKQKISHSSSSDVSINTGSILAPQQKMIQQPLVSAPIASTAPSPTREEGNKPVNSSVGVVYTAEEMANWPY